MKQLEELSFSFLPVQEKHRTIILEWFNKEHVKEFYYGEGLENTLRNLNLFIKGVNNNGDYSFEHWIAYLGEQPFGFLMTSAVEGPYHSEDPIDKWYQKGKTTITLDLLIGPEEFLGRGLGHRLIQEFLLAKFPDVDMVLIDPEITNTRAIRVYEKAGFRKVEQFIPKHSPHPHWLMCLEK